MTTDVVADMGEAFLGSRLKRLAERMQGGAARFVNALGINVQPTHMGLLAALDRSPMTVGQLGEAVGTSQPGVTRGIGQLIEMGLVESEHRADRRQRALRLTRDGEALMVRVKLEVWPQLEQAVKTVTRGVTGSFLEQVAAIEKALIEQPLDLRAAVAPAQLRLRNYSPELKQAFYDINAEWISTMFRLEAADRQVLEDPQTHILDPGCDILFVESSRLGIIGTCALRKTGPRSAELTKMGVKSEARGMKAGEFLLAAVIERAQQIGIRDLYLLTNSTCAAAIHLYEKLGFEHDSEVMTKHATRYERCDVAMRYRR